MKMTLGMIWTIILRFAIQDILVDGTLKTFLDYSSYLKMNFRMKFYILMIKLYQFLTVSTYEPIDQNSVFFLIFTHLIIQILLLFRIFCKRRIIVVVSKKDSSLQECKCSKFPYEVRIENI